ncbi:helix-turn-helix domain-containing protein [Paenibacillus sp. sptzw28]|uniref:AraC family transcriptional regulator n=1 Tax=Paenibacillus sp. sptzw28 TaxID=715179 RepID=UPI001C6E6C75|nr:helix-turn-helix domain-containing protein [Paenibacillus sp. sptzw28]QYR19569.1 helix-turn-helix domain-containing protein [Paenibacillus sp. sptzw28]
MSAYRERASHGWAADSVRLIATPSSFARTSLFYVQEVGHFRTLASYFTEREQLSSYLVVYTVSGKGRLSYRGKMYTLLPGQVFFIDCMDHQYYTTDPEEPWELLWVHLNGVSVRAYYELFAAAQEEPVIMVKPETNLPAILRELIHLHRDKSYRTELIGSKLLVELVTELVLAAQQPDGPAGEVPGYIRAVMREIEQHYAEELALEYLAGLAAVSKYHLAKSFKRYMSISPGEYIINTRITHAKELLKYTGLPVAEIAANVGVDNVSHFIRLFKDREGDTPLVFRKKWQTPR